MIKKCINCKLEKKHHAKGLCCSCYKKLKWKPNKKICICCGKIRIHHAKGLCANCYNKQYRYNIPTKGFNKCIICGFELGVHIHHIDCNHNNNNINNLVPLCQNHHLLIHSKKIKNKLNKMIKTKIKNKQTYF